MTKKALVQILEGENLLSTLNVKNIAPTNEIEIDEYAFYHITELTFAEKLPRKEAFANVLSALRIEGINFIYLLIGDAQGVNFYIGISKEISFAEKLELDIAEIGDNILNPSMQGNFRGSKINKLPENEKAKIIERLQTLKKVARVEGVPNEDEKDDEFQGVDRLIDVMLGDEFALLVIANPLEELEIRDIEKQLHGIYNKITPLVKKNIQSVKTNTQNDSTANSTSDSKNSNESSTSSNSVNTSTSKTKSTTDSTNSGANSKSSQQGGSEQSSNVKSFTYSAADSETISKTSSEATIVSQNQTTNMEIGNKALEEWLSYIDDVLLPMLNQGKSKGLFHSSIYLLADTKSTLIKLGNTTMALFSGEKENNKVPLKFSYVSSRNEIKAIKNLQLPLGDNTLTDVQQEVKILYSKYKNIASNWFGANELSVVAGFPRKEVVGLTLKEEVDFGLNVKSLVDQESLFMGRLVKSGHVTNIDIGINKKDLDKHIFIAGVTGSGKTTTCQRLLKSANVPFLVIEPAKTEYRILTKTYNDILIFTLGSENIAPFRLNPFEFFPHENITARVDMIKASIDSAFDMEAAIPQIIESAIYKCYEDYGWDIATNTNCIFENPFDNNIEAFPTISDLIDMTQVVVDEQGFDERLKNDYIGSIKARLQGLIVGAKGFMLDTPRSLDFKDLVKRNVILELEEIKNPSQKSLIMGFVLMNLNEAIKAVYEEEKKKGECFKHITLVEEAHRLLSKYVPGDSPSKKQGVEVFADMLAEVRKYGESLIIVDQIPNKLTSEVLKNTNTKIVHRLFAYDDKEAIGNTMALNSEQKEFLSNLDVGRVVMFSQSFYKPIQVQIKELDGISTTKTEIIDKTTLRKNCLSYYKKDFLDFDNKITLEDVSMLMDLTAIWLDVMRTLSVQKIQVIKLKNFLIKYKLEQKLPYVANFLIYKFYSPYKKKEYIEGYLPIFLGEVLVDRKKIYAKKDKKLNKFKGDKKC